MTDRKSIADLAAKAKESIAESLVQSKPSPSPIVIGADAIRGFANFHGVTPAKFVKNAADHVMTTIPADNEDGFAIVQLNKCEWNDDEKGGAV